MELLPREQIAFQRMLDTIRRNYERFGFLPVETPVFELSETLLTKSGGETERQVYFVQSTGALAKEGEGLPELALRFDLTVTLPRASGRAVASAHTKSGAAGLPKRRRRFKRPVSPRAWASIAGALSMARRGTSG